MPLSPVVTPPWMYALGPELPADPTTTMPASLALSTAMAVASSPRANAAPSDMLITSTPSSTALSIASTTRSVLPSQPNTLSATRLARGAMPGATVKFVRSNADAVYGPLKGVAPNDSFLTPAPAAMPATCVPCPLQSSGSSSGTGTSCAGSSAS